MRSVFVDSSAWIPLYDPEDQYRAVILPVWHELAQESVSLITTDYVIDETYTHLRRRVGLQACIAFHDLIASSSVLHVVEITSSIRHIAWEILLKRADQVLSFTDCTSFAVMSQMRMTHALTFDKDFRRVGFLVLP